MQRAASPIAPGTGNTDLSLSECSVCPRCTAARDIMGRAILRHGSFAEFQDCEQADVAASYYGLPYAVL